MECSGPPPPKNTHAPNIFFSTKRAPSSRQIVWILNLRPPRSLFSWACLPFFYIFPRNFEIFISGDERDPSWSRVFHLPWKITARTVKKNILSNIHPLEIIVITFSSIPRPLPIQSSGILIPHDNIAHRSTSASSSSSIGDPACMRNENSSGASFPLLTEFIFSFDYYASFFLAFAHPLGFLFPPALLGAHAGFLINTIFPYIFRFPTPLTFLFFNEQSG